MEEDGRHSHISSPRGWKTWPVLPLRRSGEVGTLLAHAGRDLRVFLMAPEQLSEFLRVAPSLEGVPQVRYESVESLLADGWEIDGREQA